MCEDMCRAADTGGSSQCDTEGKIFVTVLMCSELDENLDVLKRYEHTTCSTVSEHRRISCVSSVPNCGCVHSSCQLSARNNTYL